MKVKKRVRTMFFGFVLLTGLTLLYLFLPVFHYSKMIILGETSLTKEDLMKMSEAEYDKNIYLINIRQAQSKIKEEPIIKDVRISRKFPTTLVFSVLERMEVAAVSFNGGFAIIDDEGYVIKIVQNVVEVKKPIISGIKTKTIKLGEQIPVENEKQFSLILSLIAGAQNARLMDIISDVNMSKIEDVKMTTVNGITVLLGGGQNLNYKMLALHQILLDLHAKDIHYGVIDMRYNSYPVYREG